MKVVIVLTHAQLQGAYFQEAQRSAMMFSGLGHEVSFVLLDDGVLSLLEGEGYAFGLRKLGRLSGIDGLRVFALESSCRRLIPGAGTAGVEIIDDGAFAQMLLESKVVVF